MMYCLFFLLNCLWPFLLIDAAVEDYETRDVATTEGLPSNLMNESVCVISGAYTDSILDVVLPGPESLILTRHYNSQAGGDLDNAWSFNHRETVILGEAIYDNKLPVWVVGLRQPSGAQIDYILAKSKDGLKKKKVEFKLLIPKGLTNGATSVSGQTNIKNQTIHLYSESKTAVSVSGAGDRCTFKSIGYLDDEDDWITFIRQKEEKINGSVYTYESKGQGEERVRRITCQSGKDSQLYSYVQFGNLGSSSEHPITSLTTSDGRRLKYHYLRHKYKTKEKSSNVEKTSHNTRYYLAKVDHSYAPAEEYEYEERETNKELQIVCKKRPEGRFVKTYYYHYGANEVGGRAGTVVLDDKKDYRLDRVKKQQAPVGTNERPITTHRFVYQCKIKENKKDKRKELLEGITDVYDAYDHRTRFAYDDAHRLTSITRYKGHSHYVPWCKESFLWGQEGEQQGNLLGKIFKDETQKIVHHARYFTYDKRGNILMSSLCGRLTGLPAPDLILNSSKYPIENGYECERKTYTYSDDGLNLILSETDENDQTTTYEYVKGTNHIKAKKIIYHGQIQLREFYFYDDHYVLIKKVIDDGKTLSYKDLTGVTERHYTTITPRKSLPLGLPECVDESCLDLTTGRKKLIKSFTFYYSARGDLLKQEVFDANRQLAYTLSWEYDKHGNLTQETNALGQTVIKKYDANDNLIFQQDPGAGFHIKNTYDFVNRLICQEEIHEDGQRFATHHTYDYLGHCIATTDPYGHETQQTFDDFGHIVSIQSPAILNEEGQLIHPVIDKTYDRAGYPICLTDAKGRKMQIDYNIRGQPTKIVHPNGTIEQFIYQLDGKLAQKIEKNGTRFVYMHDPLGRVTEEYCYAADGQLLKRTQQMYNALHLLQSIDAEGALTTYTYDAAGRLEWIRQGECVKQNRYDALGRLTEVREWFGDQPHEYRATVKIYDLLNRVIEETLQSSDGKILHLARYAYDTRGNQIMAQIGEQQTWTEYDAHNNPIKITNSLGHQTRTVYNTQFLNTHGQRVLQTITTDPLGYQTLHTYDTANRLVETTRCNPFGVQVAHQVIFYDLCGNQCRIKEDVIQDEKIKRAIEKLYEYSEDNQITAIIEAAYTPEQKITRTVYNAWGQKALTIKPDGNFLFYDYDALGRLRKLRAGDESVAYLYDYNLRDQVTQVTDLHLGHLTERVYNTAGQMIKEKLGHGLSLHYSYDKTGRVCFIELPDQTGVEYVYDAVDLKEIHRLKNDQRLYSHFDLIHTLDGHITQAQLSGQNGDIHYAYDALGRCISMKSAQFHSFIPADGFDAAGNLLCIQTQEIPYTFTYDDHYQVKSETGHIEHTYKSDSLFNRIVKDGEIYVHNALNQILHKGNEQFIYDGNGNLIWRKKGDKETHYTYDALDRLIAVAQEGKDVTYLYDAFSRRLIKKQANDEDQLFVYQGQDEIGSWKQGVCQELRILGKNKRNPMIALELRGTPYVPLHDFSGNVACLLDLQGQVIERYRYTTFGESEILNPVGEVGLLSKVDNPWQYASKRLDKETGFIAFGLRYYDPELGRWLTPDPAGFADGSNLYAYVHNSPLLYYDQFGLYSNPAIFGLVGEFAFNFLYKAFGMTLYYHLNMVESVIGPLTGVSEGNIEDDLETKHKFREKQTGRPSEVPFKRSGTYSLNNGTFINPNTKLPFGLKESINKRCGFMNGIKNSYDDFSDSLCHLGQLSEYNITGIYSASFGLYQDSKCYVNALYFKVAYEAVRELHQTWHEFFKHCSNDATFLMICHSRGCVYVRNALMSFPEHLRERIEVLAIAPGGYIESYLCKSVIHYESKGDPVPLIDIVGRERCKDTIVTLKPHPKACQWFDHSFTSPTYEPYIQKVIDKYHN